VGNSCVGGREVTCRNAITEGEGPYSSRSFEFFKLKFHLIISTNYFTKCRIF